MPFIPVMYSRTSAFYSYIILKIFKIQLNLSSGNTFVLIPGACGCGFGYGTIVPIDWKRSVIISVFIVWILFAVANRQQIALFLPQDPTFRFTVDYFRFSVDSYTVSRIVEMG